GITGLSFDGKLASAPAPVVSVLNSSGISFSGLVVENGAGFGVQIARSSRITVQDSLFRAHVLDAVYVEDGGAEIGIVHNTIDSSSTAHWHHAIGAHSGKAGTSLSAITIRDNAISNGYSFCVEAGGFGGEAPTSVQIIDNTCHQTAAISGCGGYSLDTVRGAQITGNHYVNGTGVPGRLPGLELVSGRDAVATGNELYDANISVNKQAHTRVEGNAVTIASARGSTVSGIYVGASTPADISHNSIRRNTVRFLDAGADPPEFGIRVQCNAP